jgi:hypothetical protein
MASGKMCSSLRLVASTVVAQMTQRNGCRRIRRQRFLILHHRACLERRRPKLRDDLRDELVVPERVSVKRSGWIPYKSAVSNSANCLIFGGRCRD